MWGFPKFGDPQNGWFTRENASKMMMTGGSPIFGHLHMILYDFGESSGIFLMSHFESSLSQAHPDVACGTISCPWFQFLSSYPRRNLQIGTEFAERNN